MSLVKAVGLCLILVGVHVCVNAQASFSCDCPGSSTTVGTGLQGQNPVVCCSNTLVCLQQSFQDLCVYKPNINIVIDQNICRQQQTPCYDCCFNQSCQNKLACDKHDESARETATLILVIQLGLFGIALTTFSTFKSIREIRLHAVCELMSKYRKLVADDIVRSEHGSVREYRT